MAHQEEHFTVREKKFGDLSELPENTPALLLSAIYSGEEQKVYLKFYSPKDESIYIWRDRTNHKPYCYTKLQYAARAQEVAKVERKYTIENVKRRDLISDKLIDILKISAPDPLSIGGTENSIREKVKAWEADIKYHENYLYDTGLIPGTFYLRIGNEIKTHEMDISDKVREELEDLLWNKLKVSTEKAEDIRYQKQITRWANLLNQPIPEIKRVSVDIEVESEEGRMPTPRDHDRRITARICG